jgi:hypothetical protein
MYFLSPHATLNSENTYISINYCKPNIFRHLNLSSDIIRKDINMLIIIYLNNLIILLTKTILSSYEKNFLC